MFNQHLNDEIRKLKEELSLHTQVKESLDQEMLVISLDPAGCITAVNENFKANFAVSDKHVIGHNLVDFVPDYARATDHYKKLVSAINELKHWAGAMQVEIVEGQEAWLRVILQPIISSEGKVNSIALHGNDLTRTISSSREDQNIIGALLRSAAVIEFDMSGCVLMANDLFLQGMGYSLEQIQGQHHRMFCTQEEAASAEYRAFWEDLNRGRFVAVRFKRLNSRSEVVWL